MNRGPLHSAVAFFCLAISGCAHLPGGERQAHATRPGEVASQTFCDRIATWKSLARQIDLPPARRIPGVEVSVTRSLFSTEVLQMVSYRECVAGAHRNYYANGQVMAIDDMRIRGERRRCSHPNRSVDIGIKLGYPQPEVEAEATVDVFFEGGPNGDPLGSGGCVMVYYPSEAPRRVNWPPACAGRPWVVCKAFGPPRRPSTTPWVLAVSTCSPEYQCPAFPRIITKLIQDAWNARPRSAAAKTRGR